MDELTPVLVPSELDQLKWANLKLKCDLLRERADGLTAQANQFAVFGNALSDEVLKGLANGTADQYEPRIVEGQLQFHLKAQENDVNDHSE